MVGAGAIQRATGSYAGDYGWIIAVMVAFVIVCMATERGRWNLWRRIGFVLVAWIGHPLLCRPVNLVVVPIDVLLGTTQFTDRGVAFFASIPIVLFAMRRSRLFCQ
jgi:hypothetical protein